MDTTFLPSEASWQIKVDSVVRALDNTVWLIDRTLELTLVVGGAPTVDLTLELLVQDPALHSDHLLPVLPFGPIDVPAA